MRCITTLSNAWATVPGPALLKNAVAQAALSFGGSFVLGCIVGGLPGGIAAGTVALVASLIHSITVPLFKLFPPTNPNDSQAPPQWPWWAELIRRIVIWGTSVAICSAFLTTPFSTAVLVGGAIITIIVAAILMMPQRSVNIENSAFYLIP